MLSSRLIGHARGPGPTLLYTVTRLPRAWHICHPVVFPVNNDCQPCVKWISPLSTDAPTQHSEKDIRAMKDPVARTASPYTDPSVKGPRSQLLASRYPSAATSKSCPVIVCSEPPSLTPRLHSCSDRQLRQQDDPPSRWCCVSACRSPMPQRWAVLTLSHPSPQCEHTELGMRCVVLDSESCSLPF